MSRESGFVPDLRSYARDRHLTLMDTYRARLTGRSQEYICEEFDKHFGGRRPGFRHMEERWYGVFGEAVFFLARDSVMLLLMSRYGKADHAVNAFEMYLHFYNHTDNITLIINFLRRTTSFQSAYRIGEMSSMIFRGSGNIELAESLEQAFCGLDLGRSLANQVLYGWAESE